MKKINIFTILLLAALLFSSTQLLARSSTVVYSQNHQMDQDLDLNAVASIFGDSRDLHDFERRLNDPYYQISNLDLNRDGYVDYLRVLETVDGNLHLIVIQAVIGKRHYQDIATIEVYKNYNQTYVQVVGNAYIYGTNYIIEPMYSYIPEIFRIFWRTRYYTAYYSDYRWRHYPSYYRPWRPVPVQHYHRHIRKHISHGNRYRHTTHRRAKYSRKVHNRVKRNDYAKKYPNRSYKHRTNHKKSVKRIDKKKKYRQNHNVRKRSDRYIHKSSTVQNRTHNTLNRSAVKDRTKHRSTSRSVIKNKTRSRSMSRSEVKNRTQYKKDVKKTIKHNNRHINRQKIQEKSLLRDRRQ